MTDEDEDLIGSGNAVELLEVWQGLFRGDRLVKAGTLAQHLPYVLPALHVSVLLERPTQAALRKSTGQGWVGCNHVIDESGRPHPRCVICTGSTSGASHSPLLPLLIVLSGRSHAPSDPPGPCREVHMQVARARQGGFPGLL